MIAYYITKLLVAKLNVLNSRYKYIRSPKHENEVKAVKISPYEKITVTFVVINFTLANYSVTFPSNCQFAQVFLSRNFFP